MDTTFNLNIQFSAGVDSGYVDLPVDAARLKWSRGNPALSALKDLDPGQYWGGFRAMVKNPEGEPNPSLPLAVYDRVSADGKKTYQVYATNVLNFLPLAHRTRFELREKYNDPQTGQERTRIVATSGGKLPGYAPRKEIFGLVFNDDLTAYEPAVIVLDGWSNFISFQRAEQKWAKIKAPAGKGLVRKYGTLGKFDKESGKTIPYMEKVGQGTATPIEAIGIANPHFIDVTEDIARLFYDSQDWANCEKWNQAGVRGAEENEEDTLSAKSQFLKKADEIGLSNIDIEQLIAENDGDYRKALNALNGGLGEGGDEDFPFGE